MLIVSQGDEIFQMVYKRPRDSKAGIGTRESRLLHNEEHYQTSHNLLYEIHSLHKSYIYSLEKFHIC